MKKWLLNILLMMVWSTVMGQVAVNQWHDYLSYNDVRYVEVGKERVYAAGQMGLFYYDREMGMISRMNKTTGLSDVGISTIGYDYQSGWLVVAYNNSNVDLVKDDVVYNLSDIKRSNIPGSKTIYSIRFDRGKAYLACGFGVVVVDLMRKEIKETYYLGDGGTGIPVYDIAFDDSQIYVGTDYGLMYADKDNQFLNIIDNWSYDNSLLKGHPIMHMAVDKKGVLVASSMFDPMQLTVYRYYGGQVDSLCSGEFKSFRRVDEVMLMATHMGACIYDLEGNLVDKITTFRWGEMQVNDVAMDKNGVLWLGHEWGSMLSLDRQTGKEESYGIEGPSSNNVYSITTYGNKTFVSPGGKRTTNDGVYIPANVYTMENGEWLSLDFNGNNRGWYDVLNVAVNPKDTTQQLAVSWGNGVLEIKDNKVVMCYDETNTNGVLKPYELGEYKALRVGDVTYDDEGNAWIINSLQDDGLVRYGKDGDWRSWNTAKMVKGAEIDKLIWDSVTGYKWFMGSANKIYVHDGEGKMAWVDPNQGSKLETYMVNCMVQDQDGEIWIGTDKGIKVIYNGYKAFANGGNGEKSPVNCSNILFTEGDVVEYLMAYEGITCMAVDGANRKWVGTMNGVYLISANGQQQLEHFTVANSPLFSDRIVNIAIHPRTGEVMIGTNYGLQSYRGTAIYADSYPQQDVYAFPNPVKPDYDGPVAIKGFSRNALIHITNAAGHVVFSTVANGGQAIWNLRTNEGEKVSSGVYFVFGSDENAKMRAVAKILVVR